MATRKSHRKSRYGCKDCKKRRVKCDEAHPICIQCRTRGQACSYQNLAGGTSVSTPSSNGNGQLPTPSQASMSPPQHQSQLQYELQPQPQADHLLELKLLHHFTAELPETCSPRTPEAYYLRVVIPKVALSHPFVLDVVFSVSALHLDFLDPQSGKWLQTALFYQQRALAGFNQALRRINAQNCQAIALCSFFVALLAIASPGITGSPGVLDPAAEIVALRNLFQGSQAILGQWEAQLMEGELGPYFERVIKPEVIKYFGTERLRTPEEVTLYHSIPQSIKYMQDTLRNSTNLPIADIEIFLKSYGYLEASLHSFLGDEDRLILAFPLEVDQMIVSCLERRTTMALLLFLHYGVILHLINGKWFARGGGRRLVNSLLPSLKAVDAQEGQRWRDVIEWGQRMVGL